MKQAAQQSAPVAGCSGKDRLSEGLPWSPRDSKKPDFTHSHFHSTTVTVLSHKLGFSFFHYFISVQQNQPRDGFAGIFHIMSGATLNLNQVCKWEMGQIASTNIY